MEKSEGDFEWLFLRCNLSLTIGRIEPRAGSVPEYDEAVAKVRDVEEKLNDYLVQLRRATKVTQVALSLSLPITHLTLILSLIIALIRLTHSCSSCLTSLLTAFVSSAGISSHSP